MIDHQGGRSRSERTKKELEDMLQKEMAALSPAEREALEIVLKELSQPKTGVPTLLDTLTKIEYTRTPVDMETFVRDPYYLGNTCDNIYPKLLADLEELFSGGYHEAIWTGSIGYGKTHVATIGVCRVLYELSCMKDPHKSFGLAHGSNLSIVCTSVSEALAVKVVFEAIATKIKSSPFFEENFPFEDTKKEMRFPGGIWVAARSSTDTSALGLNAIGALMDEQNFLAPRSEREIKLGIADRAETIYNTIMRRMKSRFERHGKLPGMLFVVSSKKTVDDFTAKRIRESKGDPTVFVRDYALWDTKPEDQYSAKRFWVLGGNETVPSRILKDEEYEQLKDKMAENVSFVHVPEDFRRDFERDIEGSLRDLAGVATVAINPFIHRREKIIDAIDRSRIHPFSTPTYDPSKGGTFLWGGMVQEVTERGYVSPDTSSRLLRPIINPKAVRHVHIDPSLTGDATGFVMAHVSGWKDVARRGEDGKEYIERAPTYIVDVMLRIVPPVGGELIFGEQRRMIYDLVAHGYIVTGVTMDGWNTPDSLQQLNQRGFNAEKLSVDTSTDPYENLKTALYEDRVSYYEYQPLIEELQQLEKRYDLRKTKIDHPPKGRKDVADALAGCLFALQKRGTTQPLPFMRSVSPKQDAWMEEQQQAMMAGNDGSAINTDVMVPAFIRGGNRGDGGGNGGWGGGDDGGWYPG